MTGQQNEVQILTTMHNEALHKLDYFILGVTLAICAYLAQTNPYAQLGINKETFLLVACWCLQQAPSAASSGLK